MQNLLLVQERERERERKRERERERAKALPLGSKIDIEFVVILCVSHERIQRFIQIKRIHIVHQFLTIPFW